MKHKNIKGKIYVSKSDDFTIRCIFLDLRSPHPFTVYSLCYFSSLFTKRLEHLCDALFLLLHVWVNIEIKGCCDVGMTEQYTYSLVVAVAFNAACGKAVAQSVVFQPRYVETLHKSMIVVAVGAWLCRLFWVTCKSVWIA